jgi:hypothetical protein
MFRMEGSRQTLCGVLNADLQALAMAYGFWYFDLYRLVKRSRTKKADSQEMARIARRVCWWQSAEATLQNTPFFLCRVMVFGTWADVCFVIENYRKASLREALQRAPAGLFDNRSWYYWHHRLQILPVPALPARAIPA